MNSSNGLLCMVFLLLLLGTIATTLRGSVPVEPNKLLLSSNNLHDKDIHYRNGNDENFLELPNVFDLNKKMKKTMSKMLKTGSSMSNNLNDEANRIKTFQQEKEKAAVQHKSTADQSELEKVRKQLKKIMLERDGATHGLEQLRQNHTKMVHLFQHNLTEQLERFDNLSLAANLTVDPVNGSVVSIPNVTNITNVHKLLPKPTNKSECAAPCPCDDLGFSLCECCGATFPTAEESKEHAKETEHQVTTTSKVLRQLKHEAQKLEKQCKSETSAVEDAKHHDHLLGVALKEARDTFNEYRRLAEAKQKVRADLHGYILAAKHQVNIVEASRNDTGQKLTTAINIARTSCKKWAEVHHEFTTGMLQARNAKVEQVQTELQNQIEGEKRDVQHRKEAKLLSAASLVRFNSTLIGALRTMTSNIENEAIDGIIPASVFGVIDTSKDIQKGNLLDVLKGDCIVLVGSVGSNGGKRNVSVLDLFMERATACTMEVSHTIAALDVSIQAAATDNTLDKSPERQQRASLLRLRTVMEGDGEHGSLLDIARNMSTAAKNYRTGHTMDIELEKMTALKHTPFVPHPMEDMTKTLTITAKEENSSSATVAAAAKKNNTEATDIPSTVTIKLDMPNVESSTFEQDANIEELDAIVGIKYEKRETHSSSNNNNKTAMNSSDTSGAAASQAQVVNMNVTESEKKVQTEAQKILYSTPPLQIGEQWSKLRDQGQADTGLLQGALDNVRHEFTSTKMELDTAVTDYCGALNRHIMLDLESKFVREQLEHGALEARNASLPMPHSTPMSALTQIVTDILLRSRNGSIPSTEIMTKDDQNATANSVFYMLVPTAKGDPKEPQDSASNASTLVSAAGTTMDTARSYVAHYYSEIRRLEKRTLMLMMAKENAWQTYSEELLLQHAKSTTSSTNDVDDDDDDDDDVNSNGSVSLAISAASAAMDNLASSLATKMQATLEHRSNNDKKTRKDKEDAERRYVIAKRRASTTEAKVATAKKAARQQLSTSVRNNIFQCAAKTQKRFTKVIHARVALAHKRAMEAAKKAADARTQLLHLIRNTTKMSNSTTNKTKVAPVATIETERQTLVRLLHESLEKVMHASNSTSRKVASERADELQLRLSEFDELVAAREAVANSTAIRASAGSTGNQTAIDQADVAVQAALLQLSNVLARIRERKFPHKNSTTNHTDIEMKFMKQCMGNDTKIGLDNATSQVVATPTTKSVRKLVIAKNKMQTKKRVCRLKLQIKSAMKMLKKTKEEEDRLDIKKEIKALAHKIAMLLKTNAVKSQTIL